MSPGAFALGLGLAFSVEVEFGSGLAFGLVAARLGKRMARAIVQAAIARAKAAAARRDDAAFRAGTCRVFVKMPRKFISGV